jgi:tetrahedral aminopeptidase
VLNKTHALACLLCTELSKIIAFICTKIRKKHMLLQELSVVNGVSGDESAVREIILNAIKDHVSDIHVDTMGNLTAVKKGTSAHPLRVMVDAHMDEVGFMVMGHDADGLIRFAPIGGFDDRILLGMRVKVGKKGLQGVILSTPIHHNRDQSTKGIKDLRIDIGATSKGAAEGAVSVGERIALDSGYIQLSDTIVRGKAFDDRVGCSLLVDILQSSPYPVDVLASFAVQEEVGLRGAKIAAHRLKPDVAFALEGTTAHDIPQGDADPDDNTVPNPGTRMGQGPVLTVMDPRTITNPKLLAFARATAKEHDIPHQIKTALGGGTDAGTIHLAHTGVPTLSVSMPCRYIHSPYSMLNLNDYANMLKLVQTMLHTIQPAHFKLD